MSDISNIPIPNMPSSAVYQAAITGERIEKKTEKDSMTMTSDEEKQLLERLLTLMPVLFQNSSEATSENNNHLGSGGSSSQQMQIEALQAMEQLLHRDALKKVSGGLDFNPLLEKLKKGQDFTSEDQGQLLKLFKQLASYLKENNGDDQKNTAYIHLLEKNIDKYKPKDSVESIAKDSELQKTQLLIDSNGEKKPQTLEKNKQSDDSLAVFAAFMQNQTKDKPLPHSSTNTAV